VAIKPIFKGFLPRAGVLAGSERLREPLMHISVGLLRAELKSSDGRIGRGRRPKGYEPLIIGCPEPSLMDGARCMPKLQLQRAAACSYITVFCTQKVQPPGYYVEIRNEPVSDLNYIKVGRPETVLYLHRFSDGLGTSQKTCQQ
jgi:hypothetical protein